MRILMETKEDAYFLESGLNHEKIVKCERALLLYCNWKPLVPTCTEILKLLLFVTNQDQDFSDIIDKTNELVFSCLLSYDMCIYRYSTIALTCLLLVLEEIGFGNFS
jgi:hypothetical protein